jgi:multidrug efflux system outer membrane protein
LTLAGPGFPIAAPIAGSDLAAQEPGGEAGGPAEASSGKAPLSLAEAVALALDASPEVAAAGADAERAAAEIGVSRAQLFPALRTDASATRFEEPMIVSPLHNLEIVRTPPEFDRTLFQGEVSLGFTLFDGGARRADLRRARAESEASTAALEGTRLDLVVAVTQSYLRALTARELLEAEDLRIAALTAERDRVARFLDQGRAARVELLRAEAALSRAAADRVATQQDLELALSELRRLTGLGTAELNADRLVTARLADPGGAPDRSSLLAAALAANPDVERARRGLLAAEAGRQAARAAWFPELQLLGGFIERGSAEGDFTGEWQAGLQLGYPLFTGGARTSEIGAADAAARAARERVHVAELGAERGLDGALAALVEQDARLEALVASVVQSEEVVRIERLALDAGRGVQTDYLNAEADLLAARAALIQARNDEILARVRLARATGELSPAWIARHLEAAT